MIESQYIQESKLHIYRRYYRSGDVLGGQLREYFTGEDGIMHAEWCSDTSSRTSNLTTPTALYFLEDELNEPEYFQEKSPWFGIGSGEMIKIPILYKGEKHWAWVSNVKLQGLSREQREKLEEICSPTIIKRGFFEESVLKEEDNSFDGLEELFNNDMNRFSEVIKDYLRLPNTDACEKIFNRTVEQMTYYNCLIIFLRWAGCYYFEEDKFQSFKGLVNNDSNLPWRYNLRYFVNKVYEYAPDSKILNLLKHIANDDYATESDIKEFHDVIKNLETLTSDFAGYSPFYCGETSDFYIRNSLESTLRYNPEKWILYMDLINYLDSITVSSSRRGFFTEDLRSRKIDKEIPSETEIINVMKSDKSEEQKCQELFGVKLQDLQRLNERNYDSEICPLEDHYQQTYREVRDPEGIGYWSLFINSHYGEPLMNLTQSYYHYCFNAYWPNNEEWLNHGKNCKCTAWWAHMEATIEWWAEHGDNIRKTVRGFFDD